MTMTMESGEVRKRLKRVIDDARREARERRGRVETAVDEGERVLTQVVAPTCRQLAGVLKAEGFLFTVSTPKASVQLVAQGPGENRIEVALDTAVDPPALLSRVTRSRGSRVLVDEKVLRAGSDIGSLTDEATLEFLLAELPPFVEK